MPKTKPHPLLTDPGGDWPAQRRPHPYPPGPVTRLDFPPLPPHSLPPLLSLSTALPIPFLFPFPFPLYYHFFSFPFSWFSFHFLSHLVSLVSFYLLFQLLFHRFFFSCTSLSLSPPDLSLPRSAWPPLTSPKCFWTSLRGGFCYCQRYTSRSIRSFFSSSFPISFPPPSAVCASSSPCSSFSPPPPSLQLREHLNCTLSAESCRPDICS